MQNCPDLKILNSLSGFFCLFITQILHETEESQASKVTLSFQNSKLATGGQSVTCLKTAFKRKNEFQFKII